MKSVAIIGAGFVGGSLTAVLTERGMPVYSFDKAGKAGPGGVDLIREFRRAVQPDTVPTLDYWQLPDFVSLVEEVPDFSGIYFVCVPTPMKPDGSADLRIVESVLTELADSNNSGCDRIAVIKSTVPPGSTEKWNKQFEGKLHIIFCPEFLTEANALEDMRNQDRIVLGGPRPWINKVKMIFQRVFPKVPIIKTSSSTAEMVKYFTNVHLMVKVCLANELAQVCEALDAQGMDIDYDKVVEYATKDKRLGSSHWQVPGPDGARGAGGTCFPKDLNALIHVSRELGINPEIMEAAWRKNLEVRTGKDRDWEHMPGRAVSTPDESVP